MEIAESLIAESFFRFSLNDSAVHDSAMMCERSDEVSYGVTLLHEVGGELGDLGGGGAGAGWLGWSGFASLRRDKGGEGDDVGGRRELRGDGLGGWLWHGGMD